jgi:hypothetical protein
LVGWLFGWLVGWFDGLFVGWLVGWFDGLKKQCPHYPKDFFPHDSTSLN